MLVHVSLYFSSLLAFIVRAMSVFADVYKRKNKVDPSGIILKNIFISHHLAYCITNLVIVFKDLVRLRSEEIAFSIQRSDLYEALCRWASYKVWKMNNILNKKNVFYRPLQSKWGRLTVRIMFWQIPVCEAEWIYILDSDTSDTQKVYRMTTSCCVANKRFLTPLCTLCY